MVEEYVDTDGVIVHGRRNLRQGIPRLLAPKGRKGIE